MRAGAEPEEYNLSYSMTLKKVVVSTYVRNVVVRLHSSRLGLHWTFEINEVFQSF